MDEEDQNLLMTPEDAGRLFDPPLSSARIRQLVDAGDLRALRTASGWRLIPVAEVRRLIEERKRRHEASR